MRRMKDSGIEWIGEIPETWNVAKIKNIYSFQTGWTPSTSNAAYFEGDIPWANISDIGKQRIIFDTAKHITEEAVGNSSMEISPKGSLMYSFKLSVGDVSFCGVDMYTNEAIATFLPSERYDLRYLYYAAPFFIIKNANENIYGAKLLNQDLIKNALILDIPYIDQVSISDYLDAKCAEIDALIAAKERTNALLRERRQSIIYEAVTKGLDPTVPMRDSGIEWIGEIPETWNVAKIKNIYSFQTGWTPSTSNAAYFEGDIPWANISDIGKQRIIFDTAKHITEEAVGNSSMEISPKGSLMYSFKLSVGDVSFCGVDMYTNEAIATFLPSEKYDLRYLYYAAPFFIIKNANENIYGAKLLNQDLIKNALILDIPYIDQVSISDYLDAKCAEIDALISANEATIQKLKEYRQSVIYEAVTGKVEIYG